MYNNKTRLDQVIPLNELSTDHFPQIDSTKELTCKNEIDYKEVKSTYYWKGQKYIFVEVTDFNDSAIYTVKIYSYNNGKRVFVLEKKVTSWSFVDLHDFWASYALETISLISIKDYINY